MKKTKYSELKRQWILAKTGHEEATKIVYREAEKFFTAYSVKFKIPYDEQKNRIDDLVQECLMYLVKRFNDYNSKYSPATFLHQIWRNGRLNLIRRLVREQRFMYESKIKGSEKPKYRNQHKGYEQSDDFLLYDSLKELLHSRQFDIIHGLFYENLTLRFLADRYGCSHQNIAQTRDQALERILSKKILL